MRRVLALGLAVCGFLIAGLVMFRVMEALHAPTYRSAARVWLFPGLYLVEVVSLAFAVLVTVSMRRPPVFVVAWAALGALDALAPLASPDLPP